MSERIRLSKRCGLFALMLVVATLIRGYQIGRLSYWYDEVVTIRLARTADPFALVRLLDQIDATRAPLHPLLLQAWVKVFGPSEISGRTLSLIFGVLTVVMVERLGRRMFDDPNTGLIAGWLAALSPLLVLYSREARMYALLTLVTCFAWDSLFALSRSQRPIRLLAYMLALVALVYTHPLGLLMAFALMLASLAKFRAFGFSWSTWIGTHALAAVLIAPWIGRYFDHDPESTVGRLSIRFLLGTPIAFIGGNFFTTFCWLIAIAIGLLRHEGPRSFRLERPVAGSCLLIWFIVPPVLLYGYSLIFHPIFGPARYTLFVAPAFLILIAAGLAKAPSPHRIYLVALVTATSLWFGPSIAFVPDSKADWRRAAEILDHIDPDQNELVEVYSADPANNVEVDTARYYLGPDRLVVKAPGARPKDRRSWTAIGLREGKPIVDLPAPPGTISLPGLRLIPNRETEGINPPQASP